MRLSVLLVCPVTPSVASWLACLTSWTFLPQRMCITSWPLVMRMSLLIKRARHQCHTCSQLVATISNACIFNSIIQIYILYIYIWLISKYIHNIFLHIYIYIVICLSLIYYFILWHTHTHIYIYIYIYIHIVYVNKWIHEEINIYINTYMNRYIKILVYLPTWGRATVTRWHWPWHHVLGWLGKIFLRFSTRAGWHFEEAPGRGQALQGWDDIQVFDQKGPRKRAGWDVHSIWAVAQWERDPG